MMTINLNFDEMMMVQRSGYQFVVPVVQTLLVKRLPVRIEDSALRQDHPMMLADAAVVKGTLRLKHSSYTHLNLQLLVGVGIERRQEN